MSDKNEMIKITNTELDAYKNRRTFIDRLNQKLQILREKQIYQSLSEGTKLRIDMLKKIQNWIGLLEARIFDPNVLNELNVKQVISLLKFTGNLSLKLLAQTNDIEKIFKMYIDSSIATKNIEENITTQTGKPLDDEKITDLKKALIEALTKNIKNGAEEAVISTEEKNVIEVDKIDKMDIELSDLPDVESILPNKPNTPTV